MKLPESILQTESALEEFDVWITPSLVEIRDTARFKLEMDRVVTIFEALAEATENFRSPDTCSPRKIADVAILRTTGKDLPETTDWLKGLAAVLFLVTGKSDNNAKCQLPLFLRDKAHLTTIPSLNKSRSAIIQTQIPRVLKSETFMSMVASMRKYPDVQRQLLDRFVDFVLNNGPCIAQLWAVGRSYSELKAVGREQDILAPLVIFQVRGSVAASGGHEPEEILRAVMRDWGLEAGVDFNLADAVVGGGKEDVQILEGAEAKAAVRQKTRAYDFVLPFRADSWQPKIFVQCQFYAGDSGSVSHKNVDQTQSSRAAIAKIVSDPCFVEFVDGAGYYSSLNRDLKVLLSMQRPVSTKTFFQVRSAPIRLRRELQEIGFLVPLELEHAILRAGSQRTEVSALLIGEGYSQEEIDRVIDRCLERQTIEPEELGCIRVRDERRELVRRYLLMDIIATRGRAFNTPQEKLAACLLIPGYGPFFGMKMDEAISGMVETAPWIGKDWHRPESPLQDLRWLAEKGYITIAS